MANFDQNPFQRYAYAPRHLVKGEDPKEFEAGNNLVVFSGGDLQAYFNNIKVGNLESVTWSISVEVVGNYVMGRRDAVTYTTGKRVVVGSMVLSQYDRHALIEQVFQVSRRGISTIGSLWNPDVNVGAGLANDRSSTGGLTGVNTPGYIETDPLRATGQNTVQGNNYLTRGLSQSAFNAQLEAQLRDTARLVGAQKFVTADQVPPFDLTLVGVTRSGDAAKCALFGIQITQETAGYSNNDLGSSVGMSFVALGVSPWRPVELGDSGTLIIPNQA